MRRERIKKEVVAKDLKNEDRTFDEWIILGQILIVPDKLTGERGEAREHPDEDQYE